MKKTLFFLAALFISILSFGQNDFKNVINAKGGINITGSFKVGATTVTESNIIGYNSAVTSINNAVSLGTLAIMKVDSNYAKTGSFTSRYDFKYEITNSEQWKLWKKGGADISPLMPTYPMVNVGGTALVDGRLYLYRFYTPDTTTVHGFRIIMSTAGNYTGDNYNGIYLYRYSNDSIYAIGNTTNAADFWTSTANTAVDKALAANVTIPPGFYAVAPIYNNSAQTTAPAMEATYISAIAKGVTFTGAWKTTSYINTVTTPAASYKYTENVAGESAVPHIILVY